MSDPTITYEDRERAALLLDEDPVSAFMDHLDEYCGTRAERVRQIAKGQAVTAHAIARAREAGARDMRDRAAAASLTLILPDVIIALPLTDPPK